jgi:sec-independent protein translocase protein TatA
MFSKFGATEIIIILVIVLLFFGGRKIPELMKGLGKGVREFKDGVKGGEGEEGPEGTDPKKPTK